MKTLLYFTLIISIFKISAQNSAIHIIPEPSSIKTSNGQYTLPKSIDIQAPNANAISVNLLVEKLKNAGSMVYINRVGKKPQVQFKTSASADKESYSLSVNSAGVKIEAATDQGFYYAVQSLLQILPPQIEAKTPLANLKLSLPLVEIKDTPRFGWRGLMLDVSRHFFKKEDVKAYIDQMAKYKYNLMHWHLTDDEGWRVEIKAYPNLTKKGAFNAERVGYFGTFEPIPANEPRTYGGFYTQDDIKGIVAYAKSKYIEILPEIDVPGHSLATIVAYPELSYTPGVDTLQVRSGEPIMNWDGPHPTGIIENTLNPANPKVYEFLDKVFGELVTLFPFEYIHIGGDECPKNFWEKDAAIQALAKKEGLKDMMEVQSYFTKKIVKMIGQKGRKVIGWDEILEGGLADGAAVMSWRGEKGGIEAAKQGHEVVMTPTQYCYIDYMQGDSTLEAKVYSNLSLKKAYEFNPVPAGVDAKFVKGGQANLWTEQIYNLRYAEYMTWPRSLATAECLWSPVASKNYGKFIQKVEKHIDRFAMADVNISRAMYDSWVEVKKGANGQPLITLTPDAPGLDIHYSWDNSPPDQHYPKYTSPIAIPKEAFQLKVLTYKNGKPVGRMMSIKTSDLRKRMRS